MGNVKYHPYIGTEYLGDEEIAAVIEVITAKSLFRYDGPHLLNKTIEFEESVQNKLSIDYVLACSSGAAALKLACIGLRIQPGDEVLMSPFTFVASAGAVLSCGAIPNYVDIDESINIDPNKVEERITSKTKAIMAIHIHGVPCEMDALMNIARKHNLYIIEDAAQSFGTTYSNMSVGSIGDAAAFSLQANKVITCGEGGIFTCKHPETYKRAMRYHDNGADRGIDRYPVWDSPDCTFGENFKITEIQSAIALAQLKKVDYIIARQREIYNNLIQGIKCSQFKFRKIPSKAAHVPISLTMIFDTESDCINFMNKANVNGVGLGVFCDKLLTTYPFFTSPERWNNAGVQIDVRDLLINKCESSEELLKRVLWFPLSPKMTDQEIVHTINVINQIQKH
jgi:8-amino-3,8-dideoxy-alpha-D-manno-octulosonate transaminase